MEYDKILKLWEAEGRHIAHKRDKKYFITAAFPYPNSPQHIGHARTYTITDVMARFYKLMGYSVLFPMGFHVTGTPIIAMADRIKQKDKELFEIFENIYGISPEVYLKLTDPNNLVMFFAKEIEEGMRKMGYMIDWSRKFYTSDPHFEKFVQWHMKKLYDKGLLIKGKHPIAYSPKLNSSVGAHDTKGDIDPEIESYTGILFQSEFGWLVAATLRPETIYGITNVWIRADEKYIRIVLKDKILVVSEKAWEKLKYQFEDYKELDRIEGNIMVGKKVIVPILNKEVPLYHGSIVKPEEGTGIVMSVPGHSVYDCSEYIKISQEYPIIINIDDKPSDARAYLGKDIEQANQELYRLEFNKGFHIPLNMSVKDAREYVKKLLIERGYGIEVYRIANGPVYSRAGDEVVVKVVSDQWFIDYGNSDWKRVAKECLNNMKIVPEEFRTRFENTIEWLDKKACTRTKGLGTRFPFDKNQIVESLSDSTIYMAFYILMPHIKSYNPEQLDEQFFDYIFMGKGKPVDKLHDQLRQEFEYWYGVDARHSGVDLITNHLTFYIFNHVAIFDKDKWPKSIVTNGSVLMDGKKMSKSLGNIFPLKKAINLYGPDAIRMAVVAGSDIKADTNFSESTAKGIVQRLERFKELFRLKHKPTPMDDWISYRFYSKLNGIVDMYKNYEIKRVADNLFYEFYNDLEWAITRGSIGVPRDIIKYWNIAMFPIIPFITDSIHRELFGISVYDEIMEFPTYNLQPHPEDIFRDLVEDIKNLRNLKDFSKIRVGIAKRWKFEVYKALTDRVSISEIVSKYPGAGELIGKLKNRAYTLNFNYEYEQILKYIENNKTWLENYFGIEVEIGEEKEKYALPDKPELLV